MTLSLLSPRGINPGRLVMLRIYEMFYRLSSLSDAINSLRKLRRIIHDDLECINIYRNKVGQKNVPRKFHAKTHSEMLKGQRVVNNHITGSFGRGKRWHT